MEEHIIKPTWLQGTQWMPHFQKAANTLNQGFEVIMAFFSHVAQANQGNDAVKGRAKYILKQLREFKNLRFMNLLSILSELSLNLQKSTLTCVDFLDYLEAANHQLTQFQPGEHYTSFMAELSERVQQLYSEGYHSHFTMKTLNMIMGRYVTL